MKTFIGLTGTTCVGKSAVAVELAKKMHCEVISADSMQIYKGMDIGTAKITPAEMQCVPHHLLDIIEPNCDFSSFEYSLMASKLIDTLPQPPILVGGTGFYFDSVIYPPEFSGGNKERRNQLQQLLKENGLQYLVDYLRELDLDTWRTIDLQNPVRVVRAIEIAELGQKQSKGTNRLDPKYDAKIFVLQRDRQHLYQMIDQRVDVMVRNGLVDEVKTLVDRYEICQNSAFSAIGYKEIIAYLQGNCTLQDAVSQIKINTRHYAKRQISYFKRMKVAKFIDVDDLTVDEIANKVVKFLDNSQ